jgi:predicted RecA/RadA family phage recombinase
MAYVIAAPEMMTAAATDLATIGSNVSAAHTVAAARTTSVIPAAADEVSAGIAQLFSQHAADYQALAGQAAAFSDQFVQHLTAGAGWYAATEAANAALLQPLTAIEGSLTNAIATLQGQILDLLNSANAAFLNSVFTLLTPYLPLIAAFVVVGFLVIVPFAITIFIGVPLLLRALPQIISMMFPAALQALGI